MPATQSARRPTPAPNRPPRSAPVAAHVEGSRVVRAVEKDAPKRRAARKPPKMPQSSKSTKSPRSNGKQVAAKPKFTAATADKYELYQIAVQSPDLDVPFLARVYQTTRGRRALHFREDFCGTALLSAEWIRRGTEYTAEGFDLDPEPIAWGLAHNFAPDEARAAGRARLSDDGHEPPPRFTVHLKDVRAAGHRPADLRVAQNFSYCVFKTRAELLEYFRSARADMAEGGIFVIDMHGGSEATEEMEEKTRLPGFTYVWDQVSFWPGTGEVTCHIHFRFPDGTEMRRAFSYKWRMWYLTELKDALLEAGFRSVETYFEGDDEAGTGGNGVFRKGVRGENCLSWIAYLAALV